jgi:hypothetical protein
MNYSVLKFFAGFANAAFMDWKENGDGLQSAGSV